MDIQLLKPLESDIYGKGVLMWTIEGRKCENY